SARVTFFGPVGIEQIRMTSRADACYFQMLRLYTTRQQLPGEGSPHIQVNRTIGLGKEKVLRLARKGLVKGADDILADFITARPDRGTDSDKDVGWLTVEGLLHLLDHVACDPPNCSPPASMPEADDLALWIEEGQHGTIGNERQQRQIWHVGNES